MVNLVLISHSPDLALGAAELARSMVQESPIIIATAAGSGDENNPLGTSMGLIRAALEKASGDDGVLVLMDMGSALLSAEMALDFLDAERRSGFRLCAAPFIEGAVAAAVQASLGAALDQVEAEAMTSLSFKTSQLEGPSPRPAESAAPPRAGEESAGRSGSAPDLRIIIENKLGLHARPAARFVRTAGEFVSEICIGRTSGERRRVNAKSFTAVSTLGLRCGEKAGLWAKGPDAAEALAAIRALAEAGFGESEEPGSGKDVLQPSAPTLTQEGSIQGIAASPGYAAGPAILLQYAEPELRAHSAGDPEVEWKRLETVIWKVNGEISRLRTRVDTESRELAAIFDAQAMLLCDPDIMERLRVSIFENHDSAEFAWKRTIDSVRRGYEAMEDEYMRARAVDVGDIGRQVLALLSGVPPAVVFSGPGILVVSDLAPSDTALLDRSLVLGLCAERGGPTSHGAIIARGLGIPAVVGCGPLLDRVSDGTPLVLDGAAGRIWISPPEKLFSEYRARAAEWRQALDRERLGSQGDAITKDGLLIEVAANIGGLDDARSALDNGAAGVGLLRTEFLFLDRNEEPSEEEQTVAYRRIADCMGTLPIVVRTLDVGGDKPLRYVPHETEDNPFLGLRAIRLCLKRPEFFKTQLRAILRASPGHNLKIMFPMIAELSEFRRAKALLAEARAELVEKNLPIGSSIEVGIMVEIPAAAELAEILAEEVDFFSIGTNDLTQYSLAAERGNAGLTGLQDALHPAVLRMIARTARAGESAGKWVGVCGELAADPLAVPILVGLGVQELSVAAPAIPKIKRAVRAVDKSEAARWSEIALGMDSAESVRNYMRDKLVSRAGEM
jgi:phosphocarrier protein FPr